MTDKPTASRGSGTDAGISIRRASVEDAVALATLAARTFRDTFAKDNAAADMDAYVTASFSIDRTRAELASGDNTFLLACTSSAPIGYAKLRVGEPDSAVRGPAPTIELERIYVDAAALGGGVGAALLRACLTTARSAGYRTIWLGVWEHNSRARAFYERFGFDAVGSHAFRLGTSEQTDVVMQRIVEPLD